MNGSIWDDQAGRWYVDIEAPMRGDEPLKLSLSPEQAKALYYALEEVWPEIDEQCASI